MSEDVYVRKDVHDETMKRIEALMAASEARIEARMAALEARQERTAEKRDPRQELKESARDLHRTLIRSALIIIGSQFITLLLIVLKWLEKK